MTRLVPAPAVFASLAIPAVLAVGWGSAEAGQPPAAAEGVAATIPVTIPVAIEVQVVSEPVEVGARFEVEVVVRHPGGAEAAPVLEDALGPFRVFGAFPVAPGEVGDATDRAGAAPEETRFRIELGAFVLPGDHEIPGFPIGLRAADGELSLTETAPVPVRVVSSLDPAAAGTDADIHDIRGPFFFSLPPRWGPLLLIGAGVLVLAAAAWFLLRRRRAAPETLTPLPPPAVEAEAALAGLSRSGLLEAGEVEPYYERLAGIMKRYAGRRFATRWNDRTTAEILRDLETRTDAPPAAPEAPGNALPLLAGILNEADLAKFSEQAFRPETALDRFADAGRFLDRTRPPVTDAGGAS